VEDMSLSPYHLVRWQGSNGGHMLFLIDVSCSRSSS
jgi:hypothetical protein